MLNDAHSISLVNPKRIAVFVFSLAVVTATLVYKFDVLILLGATLAVGLLVFLFANTEFATLVVIFVLYTNLAAVLAKYYNVPAPVAASVFLLLGVPLTNYLLIRRQPILINRILWLMLAQLVVMAISAFFSDYSGPAVQRILVYVVEGVALYFLVLNTVRSEDLLRKAVWTLVIAGTLLGSLSIVQGVSGSKQNFGGFAQTNQGHIGTGAMGWGGKDTLRDVRASGTLGEENYYGQIMLMLLPLAASRFWFERSRILRILGGIACLPIAAAIMLTFSRGAFVSAVATTLVMAYLGCIKVRHLFALGLAFVLIVPLAMPDYAYRIFTLFRVVEVQSDGQTSGKSLDSSMRGRATENMAALKIFLDYPILGVGPGQTHVYTAKYSSGGLTRLEGTRQAHNMYLGVLSDTGLVGFSVFISIFIVSLAGLLKVRRQYAESRPELSGLVTGLTLAMVAFMSSAFFLSSAYERFYWLVVALAGVATHIVQRDAKAQPSWPPSAECGKTNQG